MLDDHAVLLKKAIVAISRKREQIGAANLSIFQCDFDLRLFPVR
jgi:hypothetical protein